MIADWQQFLQSNGAEFDGGTLVSFGNEDRERRATLGGDIMCDLSQYKLLAIMGSDAREFLQGQLTNDINQLSPERSQLSGFCTPKGRLISNFRLFQHDQTIFAVIPEDLFEKTQSQLQLFVVRSDVQMGDASSALIHIGVSGDKAGEQLRDQLGDLPQAVNQVLQHDRYIVIKVADKRYEVFGNVEDCKTLWQNLDVHCSAVGNQHWNLLNIRDGIPEITQATSEAFVPQMVNMDALGAINFEKGCYTGQEIVARTHYLGKQKRRMYRIHITTDTPPAAGDELATETSTENQYTGTLVTVQADVGTGYEALAVIQIKSAEKEKLKLKDAESAIDLLDLPYSLPDDT